MRKPGELIRELRVKKGLPLRKVAAFLDIDQAILSKMEQGKRNFTKEQILKLADFFHYDRKELLVVFLSDKIVKEIGDEEFGADALKAAEEMIEYRIFKTLDRKKILNRIKKRLRQSPGVHRAWLYGSFSREDDVPGSDIDIAIQAGAGFSYFDLAEIQYLLEKDLHRKIDLGFIGSFKPHILKNIKPDLKLIYEKQDKGQPR